MSFGSAFGPPPPPSPEVRLAEATDAMRGLCVHIEALIRSLGGTPTPAPAKPPANADLEGMVNAVVGIKGPATASEIAEALAARLRPPSPAGDAAQVLAAVEELTKTLDHRLRGLGAAFGTSGSVTVNTEPLQLRDKYNAEHRLAIDPDGRLTLANAFATEATAASLLAELRRRHVYKVVYGTANVPAGTTYTTIISFTPTVPVTITGFNADFVVVAAAALRYRARLITGTDAAPTVLAAEELSTEVNSWVPSTVNVAANTRVAVQVIHGELAAQDFGGTVAYYEEP